MENKNETISADKPEIEAVKLTSEDLCLTPPRFVVDGKPASLVNGWTWGLLQENPNEPFKIHMRTFTKEGINMNYGIVQMADTPTGQQTGLEHCLEMYPANNPDAGPDTSLPSNKRIHYAQVKGDPERLTDDTITYELRASNPLLLYRFSSKHARAVEADFMDLNYEYMPYALVMNENGPYGHPYIMQHCVITGTYEGRKVSYLGAWDRMYGTRFEEAVTDLLASVTFAGVRSDGLREWGIVAKVGKSKGFGYYCKDGEEPVVSSDVKLEANWAPLPYVNDGTMIPTKATFSFANKVVHYEAKWGSRGQNYKLLNWPGFSASGGGWYEESSPCKFNTSFAYSENHNALRGKVIEAGSLNQ